LIRFSWGVPGQPTSLKEALVVIDALRTEMAQQKAQIAALQAQLHEALRRLNQNSSNSDKPPSSDGPGQKPPPKKPPSGRSRGGQKGHKGSARALVDNPDKVIPCKPEVCACCGLPLAGDDPAPERHQVTELPEVKPLVIEYQRHTLHCDGCGSATKGPFPPGVSYRTFGARLTAFVGWLTGKFHLSHRDVTELLCEGFGLELALGSVSNCQEQVSLALTTPVEQVAKQVESSSRVHADETGYRLPGQRGWLWVAVADDCTLFLLHDSRGTCAAKKLLGEFDGYLVTDRWCAYDGHPLGKRQVCWSHLDRQFAGMAQAGGKMAAVGRGLVEQTDVMFALHKRLQGGRLTQAAFVEQMAPVQAKVEALLSQGAKLGEPLSGRCAEILKLRQALWTFVFVAGLEPTNNRAERAVRQAVLWRKSSYGVQSERGAEFVERILTVLATCRQQGLNALAFLVAAVTAKFLGTAAPSLLPLPVAQPP
jgi:transposase